ncbi:hypothetical protein [Aliikangiella sp. IMCC44359]|uniref:hypothetical protein n=1 Tax=Aliikangiella sp. IMCC44359 TaxID=3459125 RepID=UPI00403AB691
MFKLIKIVLLLLLCTSCGQSNTECPITIDTVSIIDQKLYEGTHYYMVLRISGWHEKTEIIEVYDQKPQFDRCSVSITKPIIHDSLDANYINSFLIDLEAKEFIVEYKESPSDENPQTFFRLKFK